MRPAQRKLMRTLSLYFNEETLLPFKGTHEWRPLMMFTSSHNPEPTRGQVVTLDEARSYVIHHEVNRRKPCPEYVKESHPSYRGRSEVRPSLNGRRTVMVVTSGRPEEPPVGTRHMVEEAVPAGEVVKPGAKGKERSKPLDPNAYRTPDEKFAGPARAKFAAYWQRELKRMTAVLGAEKAQKAVKEAKSKAYHREVAARRGLPLTPYEYSLQTHTGQLAGDVGSVLWALYYLEKGLTRGSAPCTHVTCCLTKADARYGDVIAGLGPWYHLDQCDICEGLEDGEADFLEFLEIASAAYPWIQESLGSRIPKPETPPPVSTGRSIPVKKGIEPTYVSCPCGLNRPARTPCSFCTRKKGYCICSTITRAFHSDDFNRPD